MESSASDTPPLPAPPSAPLLDDVPAAPAPGTAAPSPEAESLNRIRSILFGQQVQTFETRFEALEADLVARVSSLDAALRDRAEALATRLDTLRDDTSARFHAQHATHQASTDALRAALGEAEQRRADASAAHEAALADASARHEQAHADAQAAATARADAQDETARALAATVDRLTDALAREKTDRDFLATLFEQAAQSLRRGPASPDA